MGARQTGDPVGDVGALGGGVVHAVHVEGEITTAVDAKDLDAGVTLDDTAEHDPRQRDRGLHRVADDVDEVVVGEAAPVDRPVRVEDDEDVESEGPGPKLLVGGVVVVGPLCRRVDRDTAKVVLGDDSLQLGDRSLGMVHRQRAEADEPIRMRRDEPGDGVVLEARHLGSEVRLRPVVVLRRSDGDRLDVDALAVHHRNPDLRVGEFGHDRLESTPVVGVGALAAPPDELVHLGGEVRRDELGGLGHERMAMDVDGLHVARRCPPCLCRRHLPSLSSGPTGRASSYRGSRWDRWPRSRHRRAAARDAGWLETRPVRLRRGPTERPPPRP